MRLLFHTVLYLGLALTPVLSIQAQEGDDPEAIALSKLAHRYVAAYNDKKIDDMLALFTPEAEMIDEIDGVAASGLDEIRETFEKSFQHYPDRKIELETVSVREIASNLVIEEGVATFSGEAPNEEGDAASYSAILINHPEKGWRIASSRKLPVEMGTVEPLVELYPLLGEWIYQGEQMNIEYNVNLGPSDRSLLGHAIVTSPSEGTSEVAIRIAYDGAAHQIRWWSFDDFGGFSEGTWDKEGDSWIIRTKGVTANGERTSQLQKLTFSDNDHAISWETTHHFVNGELQPDDSLRLVRRPPAPAFPVEAPVAEHAPETSNP